MIYQYTKTQQTLQRVKYRKSVVTLLDRLSREFTKKRAMKQHKGCQCCALMNIPGVTRIRIIRRWEDLEWAHYKSRGKHSVKWDEDNEAGLCDLCHKYLDAHPKIKEEFFRKLFGDEAIDDVIKRAETVIIDINDYQLMVLHLKQLLEGLNGS